MNRLEGWDWFRLHDLSHGPDLEEELTGRSGAHYRVRVRTCWDMEDWGSDLHDPETISRRVARGVAEAPGQAPGSRR